MFNEGKNCTYEYPNRFSSKFQLEWFEISTDNSEYSNLIESSSKYYQTKVQDSF